MDEETTTFVGTIENVMETWPVQLTVTGKAGNLHFKLHDASKVTRQKALLDPGHLRPGMIVSVRGVPEKGDKPRADLIEILGVKARSEEPQPDDRVAEPAAEPDANEKPLSSPSEPMPPSRDSQDQD